MCHSSAYRLRTSASNTSTPFTIYYRLTFMFLRCTGITVNIAKMDVLLALAAGVVMFSYFVPTVEAYNPEEQKGKLELTFKFLTYLYDAHS